MYLHNHSITTLIYPSLDIMLIKFLNENNGKTSLIMQQAALAPAFPVFRLPWLFPRPMSSSPKIKIWNSLVLRLPWVIPSCTTIALPKIEWGPWRSAFLSTLPMKDVPDEPELMLPKSPTCLSFKQRRWKCCKLNGSSMTKLTLAVAAPWFLFNGLKWPPAALQLLLVSPNSWTWKPCLPGAKPWIFPEILIKI